MTFIFHPLYIQYRSYCANAQTCPAHARASGLEPSGPALRTAAHALKALCLYCVTGGESSPDVLTRLLESNRKSIRIPLPQGTGDPLHAAFEIVQQLALQGHPVPLHLLRLRKSFPDAGRNYAPSSTPISMPGWKPSRMPPKCSQAKPSCEPGAFHSRGSISPLSIVPGCPRERSRLISRARSPKVVQMHKQLLARFGNPCDVPCRGSGITRSPHKEKT